MSKIQFPSHSSGSISQANSLYKNFPGNHFRIRASVCENLPQSSSPTSVWQEPKEVLGKRSQYVGKFKVS